MENKMNCPKCNKSLDENVNFCSYCGEAISDIAKKLENEKKQTAELEILVKLIDYIKDENDLNFIKNLIEKLS